MGGMSDDIIEGACCSLCCNILQILIVKIQSSYMESLWYVKIVGKS